LADTFEVIWIDPRGTAGDSPLEASFGAALRLNRVRTIEEVRSALPAANAIVLHLLEDVSLLREVQQLMRDCSRILPVICRVDRGCFDLVVKAVRHGAAHVLAADEQRAAAWNEALAAMTAGAGKPQTFVFIDPVSQKLLALAQRVAQAEVTALLTGPTGAGKEVLARILHEASPRHDGPFVALNCAAMPESMIEDLLFGHEKGAFTGALREHAGVFEQAKGGTLFLDEVGEMPIRLQAKLLRVLQERQLTRLGAQSSIAVDVRLIAATNRNLKAAIETREFREDLYFRISTFKLQLPPLSERPADILPLAYLMLERHGVSCAEPWAITAAAEQLLVAYPWPGNVRELGNVMQRAMVLAGGAKVDVEHLIFDDAPGPAMQDVAAPLEPREAFVAAPSAAEPDLNSTVRASEHRAIMTAIRNSASRSEAARALGISPRTLRYKLAQFKGHGLDFAISERACS